MEGGENITVGRTGAVNGGVLAFTIDSEGRGCITAFKLQIQEAPFGAALVSTSMG